MKNKKLNIEITNEHYFDKVETLETCIRLYDGDTLQFIVYKNSKVVVYSNTKIYTYDNSLVFAYNNSIVYAYNYSKVYAKDNVIAYTKDNSIIYAYDKSRVDAYDSSTIYAHDKSTIDVYEFSTLYIYNLKVTVNAINHFGAIIKQVFKLKKDILVYKKLQDDKIATLKLVKGQTFQSKHFGKCRTDKALVVAITNIEDTEEYQTGISVYYDNCIYEVGKEVIADGYDKTIEECSNGIHFFLTREKAEKYEL